MRLVRIKRLFGVLELKSGLRIGMSKDLMAIGDVDNPVIRNPLTEEPYIPGSSLKGKMRYLMEWALGGAYIADSKEFHVHVPNDPNDPIGRVFGSAPNTSQEKTLARQRGPTRLLVRDAYLTRDSRDELAAMTGRGGYLTEVKQEVFIPRLGGDAKPRTAERVPAGARFDFELVYRVFDMAAGDNGKADEDNFKYVEEALRLLQLDGLGGYISRGYGQLELDYQVENNDILVRA
jgi:CRISPR-associated protein Csm3